SHDCDHYPISFEPNPRIVPAIVLSLSPIPELRPHSFSVCPQSQNCDRIRFRFVPQSQNCDHIRSRFVPNPRIATTFVFGLSPIPELRPQFSGCNQTLRTLAFFEEIEPAIRKLPTQ